MGRGLKYGRSGSLEHSDSQCLESKRGWAWNHLLLWGNKSTFSRSGHRLKTLSDGAEDRSNRRRIDVDAGPGVGALLTLAFLLALA
jgi:hypothetical protein